MEERKNVRLLRPNGSINIKPKGISIFKQTDLHNRMITMNWLSFFIVITLIFVTVNILFTVIYISLGTNQFTGVLKHDFWGYFLEIFFFSTQTLTTLGYGRISPIGVASSSVSAVESMLGVLAFAFATGLSYARFARPRPKIIYSKTMVIGPYQGEQALMVRVVNYKKKPIGRCNC